MTAVMAVLATPVLVSAKIPGDLNDLIGIRASSLDSEMEGRGYSYIKSKGLTQYWWKNASRACVWAVTDNGIISSIQAASPGACGKSGTSGSPAPANDGLGGLNGMDAIKAIDVMSSRGFTNVNTITTPGTMYSVFYNRKTRVCAQLTIADQQVLHVDKSIDPKCR